MKISANLLEMRPRLALPLAITLWMLCGLLITSSIALVTNAIDMRSEQPQLVERQARLQEQLSAVTLSEPLPATTELTAMRQRVSALNSLTGIRGWTTSQLFSWLETKVSDNVYLVSMHHKPRDGEIMLVAESSSAEALTGFLLKLEKEPHFSEVLLNKQGTRTGTGPTTLQFEVRVRQKP